MQPRRNNRREGLLDGVLTAVRAGTALLDDALLDARC
jgi:hypothetical protein